MFNGNPSRIRMRIYKTIAYITKIKPPLKGVILVYKKGLSLGILKTSQLLYLVWQK